MIHIFKSFQLIWVKAIFSIRSEASSNTLSYAWFILEPLIYVSAFYLIFGHFFNRGGEDYIGFLLTGLIPFMWFSKSLTSAFDSILKGKNVITKFSLPLYIFPLSKVLERTIKQLPAFIFLLLFILIQLDTLSMIWLVILLVILVQLMVTVALGLLFSMLTVFVRDLVVLMPTGMTVLLFVSGIFFDVQELSPRLSTWLQYNPISFLIVCYRDILLNFEYPDFVTLFLWGLSSLALSIFLCYICNFKKGLIIRKLL